VQHLFQVAAGLELTGLGRTTNPGQITDAYEAALAQGAAGTTPSALFRAAIHAAARAHRTTIGVNPASISSVAAPYRTTARRHSGRQVLMEPGNGSHAVGCKNGVPKLSG
jgi:glutamyl-tRNA reductase